MPPSGRLRERTKGIFFAGCPTAIGKAAGRSSRPGGKGHPVCVNVSTAAWPMDLASPAAANGQAGQATCSMLMRQSGARRTNEGRDVWSPVIPSSSVDGCGTCVRATRQTRALALSCPLIGGGVLRGGSRRRRGIAVGSWPSGLAASSCMLWRMSPEAAHQGAGLGRAPALCRLVLTAPVNRERAAAVEFCLSRRWSAVSSSASSRSTPSGREPGAPRLPSSWSRELRVFPMTFQSRLSV